jgi:hypothetical protein
MALAVGASSACAARPFGTPAARAGRHLVVRLRPLVRVARLENHYHCTAT